MISGRGVGKRYGDQVVLEGLDFRIAPGERVALLGTNGAGKTTLLRCLLGLTRFEGELTIGGFAAGSDGREGRLARAQIGYVPQQPPRFDLTLEEFVDLFARLRGVRVDGPADALRRLGMPLDSTGGKRLRELSGGMLQKALLALCLGSRVPVLLLDEPTASLDAGARRDFLEAVREAPAGTTLLFASHRLDDVQALADRALLLEKGRFAFDGTVAEMLRRGGALAGGASRPRAETDPLPLDDVAERLLRHGSSTPSPDVARIVPARHAAGGAP